MTVTVSTKTSKGGVPMAGTGEMFKNYGLATLLTVLLIPTCVLAQDPTLSGIEAQDLAYDEGQVATAVTNTIVVSDGDNPTLPNATIQITGNYVSTEDKLAFADAFSITGAYDATTGTLTLTGPATLSDFTNALRSVTYQNTNNDHPSNLVRTITFMVNDGAANSLPVTRNIQVNRINDTPIGQDDSFVMYEDTDLDCGCLLINDVDPDGDHLIALHADPPSHGTVSDQGGFFIYTPDPDFYGQDSFTYYANDGTENSLPITVNITVLPVNDAPVAVNDAITTNEDTQIGIPVLSNDSDVDDVLNAGMIVVVSTPAHGTVVVNNTTGQVDYTPALNYNGNDSFTYQVKDASDALSNTATVNITINPVNDVPVALADAATTPEETLVSIPVLSNDTDVEGTLNTASLVVATNPAHGAAVADPNTGAISYTPVKDFTGTDTFTYTVADQDGATSSPATVTVTVTPVNDPPVAVDDAATTDRNVLIGISILANDYDVDNEVLPASVIVVTNPTNGSVSYNPGTGVASYSPSSGYVGDDSFTYTIADPDGLTSLPATVTITVLAAENKPPVAEDDGPIENGLLAPVTIDVLANDYDPDNAHDELSIVSVTNPSSGSVSIVNGKIVYQPEGLISGIVTFTYTIQDPAGLTDEAIVTIENEFPPLTVSEGFSPNSDSNNDTWYILGIENYPNNSIKIFDRWGFLVYQKQHYENTTAPWDGRGNTAQQSGKLLDQGTYYYILEPGGELTTMTGYVVIVR